MAVYGSIGSACFSISPIRSRIHEGGSFFHKCFIRNARTYQKYEQKVMGQTNEDRHETFEPLKKFLTSKLFQNKVGLSTISLKSKKGLVMW